MTEADNTHKCPFDGRLRRGQTKPIMTTHFKSPSSSTMQLMANMILTTGCLLLALSLVSYSSGQLQQELQQPDSGLIQQSAGPMMGVVPTSGSTSQLQRAQPKQIEMLVQPNSPVRIECKLPTSQTTQAFNRTSRTTFYWNFQRLASVQDQKPDLLCYGTDCINAATYNIELDFDQASGSYDLIINNATYELNDGIYYCDYRDTSPESRQIINREIRLTVLIPPQAPTISAGSAATAREGQEYQLNCQSIGGNPEPNITWFKNDQQIFTPGSGQAQTQASLPALRIEQVRQNGTTTSLLTWIPTIDDHQAIYKCSVSNKAMNGLGPLEREVTLSVEYAPRITVGPFNPLKVLQGDRATISCQVDANPPVKTIRWYRDGHHMISNQYNHTIQEVKISDSSVYSCQADNGIAPVLLGPASSSATSASGQSGIASGVASASFFSFLGSQFDGNNQQSKTLVEARLQLEVLYAPRVQIRESRTQPLNEGDYLTLNCSVESWPPVYEFVWSKQDESGTGFRRISSSPSPALEFQSLSASDMGNYTCTAFNRLEPSSASATGQVVLERQGSASLMLYVRHKPGLAEIHLGQSGETEVGNKTLIQCRAKPPGYPEPRYSFWRWQQASSSSVAGPNSKGNNIKLFLNKNSGSQDSTYTIFSARSEDEGKYGCMVSNVFGSSNEAIGDLVVNEAPSIVLDKTWREEDARKPGDYAYSITVRASGKPEPRVAWFHRSPVDGRRIDLSSAEMQSKFRIETQSKPEPQSREMLSRQQHEAGATNPRPKYVVLSTLTFKAPLEIDDRGLYSVEFSNGLSRIAVENHQLHISHSPIPAIKNMPVLSRSLSSAGNSVSSAASNPSAVMTRTRAGFNLGETVNLTCRVSAYPQPQFVWHSQSSGAGLDKTIDSDSRYRMSVSNYQDDIWEGTMSFELSSESDYGDYMCVTANQDPQTQLVSDSTRILIHLGRKTAPEAPIQVEQVEATQDSVSLQWIPGFDGGFVQNQFVVQYAPDDNSGLSLMRRYGPLVSDQQQAFIGDHQQLIGADQYPKLYDCLSMNPCTINNLQPRQAYLMRVRARNELGFSDFSDDLRVSTRANISQIPRIQEAHFDWNKNILRFRVEPNPEYLLHNLEARIEVRGSTSFSGLSNSLSAEQPAANYPEQQQQETNGASEWRRYPSVPIRHEQGEAYLNMQPDSEQLKLTLCSRLNESLCGQEFILSTQSVTSSFLRDQQGLSISILASSLILILLVGGFATTVHSCCLSRKAKKAAALDHVDSTSNQANDNKSLGGHVNGGLSLSNGNHANVVDTKVGASHGSTTSTNSTSANGRLASMDSINTGHLNSNGLHNNVCSASDHSSDHSRQAKLDSMLPPNYSHYADRASLMLEQQQQQQQQQQQAAFLQDKLGSPFGLTNGTLLHPSQMDAQLGDYFGSYDPSSGAVLTSLEQQQQSSQMDNSNQQVSNTMMLNSVLNPTGIYDPSQLRDASLYSAGQQQQQMMDDYNNYNALAYQQQHEQMMESAYGTTTAAPSQVIAQAHQASYDNNANQSYCHQSYGSPYDQQQQQQQHADTSASSQYQQDLAAAQQQMYGTLTSSNSYNRQATSAGATTTGVAAASNSSSSPNSHHQDQYAGLMPPPPPPPPQESDYGTTGRGGRLIREIIV